MLARSITAVGLVSAALCCIADAGAAPLQPGTGDDFFIPVLLQNEKFSPIPTVSAIQSVIPLAKQVCDAKKQGQDDLQAAHVFYAGGGVAKLGFITDSVAGDQSAALDVTRYAILAYCPSYNTTNW